jgi:hypothetical protein
VNLCSFHEQGEVTDEDFRLFRSFKPRYVPLQLIDAVRNRSSQIAPGAFDRTQAGQSGQRRPAACIDRRVSLKSVTPGMPSRAFDPGLPLNASPIALSATSMAATAETTPRLLETGPNGLLIGALIRFLILHCLRRSRHPVTLSRP